MASGMSDRKQLRSLRLPLGTDCEPKPPAEWTPRKLETWRSKPGEPDFYGWAVASTTPAKLNNATLHNKHARHAMKKFSATKLNSLNSKRLSNVKDDVKDAVRDDLKETKKSFETTKDRVDGELRKVPDKIKELGRKIEKKGEELTKKVEQWVKQDHHNRRPENRKSQ